MRNERARPQQCWKSFANESNIVALRFGDHGTKEMLGVVGWIVWLVSNFAQQHATTSNNMQQGVQTNATCSIQQCCVRLHAVLYLNKLSRLYAEFRLTAENRNHARQVIYSLFALESFNVCSNWLVCLSTCVTFVYANFYIAFAEWKWYKHLWDNRNSVFRYFKLISNRRSPSSKSNKWTIIISVYFFNIWHKYS